MIKDKGNKTRDALSTESAIVPLLSWPTKSTVASSTTDLFALLARLTISRSSTSKPELAVLMEPLYSAVDWSDLLSLLRPMAPFMEEQILLERETSLT